MTNWSGMSLFVWGLYSDTYSFFESACTATLWGYMSSIFPHIIRYIGSEGFGKTTQM